MHRWTMISRRWREAAGRPRLRAHAAQRDLAELRRLAAGGRAWRRDWTGSRDPPGMEARDETRWRSRPKSRRARRSGRIGTAFPSSSTRCGSIRARFAISPARPATQSSPRNDALSFMSGPGFGLLDEIAREKLVDAPHRFHRRRAVSQSSTCLSMSPMRSARLPRPSS